MMLPPNGHALENCPYQKSYSSGFPCRWKPDPSLSECAAADHDLSQRGGSAPGIARGHSIKRFFWKAEAGGDFECSEFDGLHKRNKVGFVDSGGRAGDTDASSYLAVASRMAAPMQRAPETASSSSSA
jgi:hypothetical protein